MGVACISTVFCVVVELTIIGLEFLYLAIECADKYWWISSTNDFTTRLVVSTWKKKDWGTWVETAEKGKKLKEEIGRQKGQNNSQSVKVKAKSQGKKKSTAKVMKDQDQEEKSKAKPSGKRKKKNCGNPST